MRSWVFQDPRQKQKLGDKAPWSAGWYDPEGRRKSKRIGSRSQAEKFARRIEGQLAAGTYQTTSSKTWADFRKEYLAKLRATTSVGNQSSAELALNHFERLVHPKLVRAIRTTAIDGYVNQRKSEGAAPATINRELRHIKAALRVARDYKYLPELPRIRMLREPERLPRIVTPADFTAIYSACDAAKHPQGLPYQSGDWWRALLVFLYLTGWRIREALVVLRDDVNLAEGWAVTRASNNKGKRDERIPLHPLVVEHLHALAAFSPMLFHWPVTERRLWREFQSIQRAAGIQAECDKHRPDKHTPTCRLYGFHDLRRAFATANAARLDGPSLQKLMRHKSFTTTLRYINAASRLDEAVGQLAVPELPAKRTAR